MKNILILFLSFLMLNLAAQERTVDLGIVNIITTKNLAYNGGTLDRLIPTTRDTIDYTVTISNYNQGPINFTGNFTFDTIAGADTTVKIYAQYKTFSSQTYAAITNVTSDTVNAEVQKAITTLGVIQEYTETITMTDTEAAHTIKQDTATFKYYPADSLKVPLVTHTIAIAKAKHTNPVLYFHYLKFRLIISGNDLKGTGIKVKRVEIQFYN